MNDHVDDHVSDRLGGHLEGDLSLAEFARVDAHLERCADCAAELRELRATVALLRGLPDLEPPAELADEVMRRIEAGAGRPSRVVPLFRRVAAPRFAAALAAGFAGLMLFTSSEFGTENLLGFPSEPSPDRIVMSSDSARVADGRRDGSTPTASIARTSATQVFPASARRIAAYGGVTPPQRLSQAGPVQGFGFFGTAAPEAPLRDLDGELEALMADPGAFLERVRRTSEASRRPLVAPLVEYSARRGDASAVARLTGIAVQPQVVRASTR